jgi:hypothetical protein
VKITRIASLIDAHDEKLIIDPGIGSFSFPETESDSNKLQQESPYCVTCFLQFLRGYGFDPYRRRLKSGLFLQGIKYGVSGNNLLTFTTSLCRRELSGTGHLRREHRRTEESGSVSPPRLSYRFLVA